MDCTTHTIDEWSDFQRLLVDVSDGKTEETAEELIESKFIQTEKDVLFLLNNLSTVMRSNPGKLKYFALFIKHIITRFDENLNFPQHFLETFHTYDKFTFLLYRELFLLGFVQIEDIVAEFHDPKYSKEVRRTLLITFLPELYRYDQETVNMAFNELSSEKDLFKTKLTRETYEANIQKIEFFLQNGQEKGSISLAIKKDNAEELKKIVNRVDFFNYKQSFKSSEFELVPVADLSIITAAAMFGSVNCFKFLYLNDSLSDQDDNMSVHSSSTMKSKPKAQPATPTTAASTSKKTSAKRGGKSPRVKKETPTPSSSQDQSLTPPKEMRLTHAAVYGGNHEILHILQQNKFKFDGTLFMAAKNFRPDVFEWLISTFPITMIIKPVTANGILTELIKNCDFSSLISFFNSELKERLVDKVGPIFHAVKAANAIVFAYVFNQLKANPNTCNSSGYSLLHLVSDVDTANFLYSLPNLDINPITKDGFTPLHEYASKGYVELGKMFLEHSHIHVSVKSSNGMTPLHCAASCGKADFIHFLLTCKEIEVNATDRDGNTPLHYAARASNKRTVDQLLSAEDIDINLENIFKETPYFLAAKLSNADVFSSLAEIPSVDINQKDSNGNTALIYAIERPCLSIFEYLLSVDTIDVNMPDDEFGKTPLMHIVSAPRSDEINQMFETMLIVHGLNINAQDKRGNTVIHTAYDLQKKEFLSRLIAVKGINMNLSNGRITIKEIIEGKINSKTPKQQSDSSDESSSEESSDSDDNNEIKKQETPAKVDETPSKVKNDSQNIPTTPNKQKTTPKKGKKSTSKTPKKSPKGKQEEGTKSPASAPTEPKGKAETPKQDKVETPEPVKNDKQNDEQKPAKDSKGGCCRI